MNSLALRPERPVDMPATYEIAKRALAHCERIDECQEMANQAAAIAVYAAQAKDDSLIIMAQRIQARAIRRCGELLKALPAAGTPTRTSVARAAGMSRVQQRQAAQIAQIPERRFEQIVESTTPPKPYKLAEIGVRKRGRPRKAAAAVTCCPTCGRPL